MWSNLKTLVQYVRRHPPSRLMVYGLLVGLVSGIGASLFLVALEWLTFFFGHEPIFATPDITFTDPRELLIYAVLGLICVPVGWLYSRSLYGLRDRIFRRLPLKRHFVPAVGGLAVGCLGLLTPKVLSGGYGVIQSALLGDLPLGLMASLALLKVFATSCTIGSGGSGGVFGPSLFIGAMLGGVVGKLGNLYFPGIVEHSGAFALVGMAGFFAGVAKAPIGALVMVSEMTRGTFQRSAYDGQRISCMS